MSSCTRGGIAPARKTDIVRRRFTKQASVKLYKALTVIALVSSAALAAGQVIKAVVHRYDTTARNKVDAPPCIPKRAPKPFPDARGIRPLGPVVCGRE